MFPFIMQHTPADQCSDEPHAKEVFVVLRVFLFPLNTSGVGTKTGGASKKQQQQILRISTAVN